MLVLVAADRTPTTTTEGFEPLRALDGELVMPRPAELAGGAPFVGVASKRPADVAVVVELPTVTPELLSIAVADGLGRLGLLDEAWTTDDADRVEASLDGLERLIEGRLPGDLVAERAVSADGQLALAA